MGNTLGSGRQGEDGKDGIDGRNGAIGPRGPAGLRGEQGPAGPMGPAGPSSGSKGDKGDKGDNGYITGLDSFKTELYANALNCIDGTCAPNEINMKNLKLANVISDNRIELWTGYGFGIRNDTLLYKSGQIHEFVNSGGRVMLLNREGDLTLKGKILSNNRDVLAEIDNINRRLDEGLLNVAKSGDGKYVRMYSDQSDGVVKVALYDSSDGQNWVKSGRFGNF